MTYASRSPLGILALVVSSCAASPPPVPPPATSHPHELHLPPVGPTVRVTFAGNGTDVAVASIPHEGESIPLLALWKTAWPNADPTSLHFDLTGSDGFHPAARPPCAARLLTSAEVTRARMNVVTHDISFEEGVLLPGCYHVHAVVAFDGVK